MCRSAFVVAVLYGESAVILWCRVMVWNCCVLVVVVHLGARRRTYRLSRHRSIYHWPKWMKMKSWFLMKVSGALFFFLGGGEVAAAGHFFLVSFAIIFQSLHPQPCPLPPVLVPPPFFRFFSVALSLSLSVCLSVCLSVSLSLSLKLPL